MLHTLVQGLNSIQGGCTVFLAEFVFLRMEIYDSIFITLCGMQSCLFSVI